MTPVPGDERYDLFVSYAHADNRGAHQGKVAALVAAVRDGYAKFAGRPLRVFFDLDGIGSMDHWREKGTQLCFRRKASETRNRGRKKSCVPFSPPAS